MTKLAYARSVVARARQGRELERAEGKDRERFAAAIAIATGGLLRLSAQGGHSVLRPWLHIEAIRQGARWRWHRFLRRLPLLVHVAFHSPSDFRWAMRMPLIEGAAAIEAKATGGKWGEAGTWVGEAVPTAADDVFLTAASGNVTIGVEAKCRSLNCTGYVATLKHENVLLKIGDATAGAENVALKFNATMTFTPSATANINFESTSATEQTINFAGKTTRQIEMTTAGKWKFTGSVTCTAAMKVTRGTIDYGEQTYSWYRFSTESTNARSINLDGCTIAITGNGGVAVWGVVSTNMTSFTTNNMVATITDTGANEKKLTLAAMDYSKASFVIEGGGAGVVALGLTTNNTVKKLEIKGPKTVKLGAGKTLTLEQLVATGTAENKITIESSAGGEKAILKKTTGTVALDYVKLKDIKAEGGASWFAGSHSEDVSGNEGWTFTDPASAPSVIDDPVATTTLARFLEEDAINPNGEDTEAWFEWGETVAYEHGQTTKENLGSGNAPVAMTPVLIAGLVLGQTYHYRAVAQNAKGEAVSADKTFTPTGSSANLSLCV